MEEKLSIRVNVAERFYPLKISRADEEKIRRAARLINEKVLQYKQRYADKDTQDFLAMASLQFVIRLIECEEKTDFIPVLDQLKDIEHELEEFLQNKKKSNSVL